MEFISRFKDRKDEIIALFSQCFADADGPEEGALIETLVTGLLTKTKDDDLFVFSALQDGAIVGCIAFSRLRFAQDDRTVFLLSPVAVSTDLQRQRIGQRLLRFGLDTLREQGVDVAITYGDPNYYSKVGFAQITEEIAQAPLPLSQPIGWLAQSLTDRPLDPLRGPSRCVQAFDTPNLW